ncbi:MAG: thiosulfate oxidation carrier complex protein SoxZ [Methylobacillus glycogenes]|nr:thiosulfate oxidation carrier complex protein SoxZ [Methylobacillus glycogenes]
MAEPVEHKMKMRARLQQGVAEVRLLISHPMETGRRKNEAGEVVAAHFIQWLQARHGDKVVLEAQWGTGIAKDPYLIFYVANAAPGDIIKVEWQDNKGVSGQHSLTLS